MDTGYVFAAIIIISGFTAALVLIGALYRKERQDRRLATHRKYQKLREAGEDSRVALRKFHRTKETSRTEARRYWQAEYDALVPNAQGRSSLWFPYSCFPGMDDDLRIRADLINRRMMNGEEI